MGGVSCATCAAPVHAEDRYCGVCGASLAAQSAPHGVSSNGGGSAVPFGLLVLVVALAGLLVGGGVGWLVVG